MRVAVVTISDSASGGARDDTAGEFIVQWIVQRGDEVLSRTTVPDDTVEIVRALLVACDDCDAELVLTTGGTGLSSRDVTPEATLAVSERVVPGIAESLRVRCMDAFPRAVLARGVAGVRGQSLIVNLPGSPGGVRDGLRVLDEVIDHACDILRGRITAHPPAQRSGADGV